MADVVKDGREKVKPNTELDQLLGFGMSVIREREKREARPTDECPVCGSFLGIVEEDNGICMLCGATWEVSE